MMKDSLIWKYIEICNELGWRATVLDDGNVELENWSPAGENLIYYVRKEHFLSDLEEIVENFDPDEHAEQWVIARHNSGSKDIPCIETLVLDSQKIDGMLYDLLDALKEFAK